MYIVKFKIWSIREKKFWLDGRGITLTELAMSYRQCLAVPESYQFPIYTGVKDANGTEIYEGDFLRYPNGNRTIIFYDPYSGQWIPLHNKDWRKDGVVDGTSLMHGRV